MPCDRDRHESKDEGFTLIELLVVIIIIGILAGIAIPLLLQQRGKAFDAAAKADLRSLAEVEELHLVAEATYGSIADLRGAGGMIAASDRVTLSVVLWDDSRGYCLSAVHDGSPTTWFYDSLAGGLQPSGSSGCPTTTAGTPGDSTSG